MFISAIATATKAIYNKKREEAFQDDAEETGETNVRWDIIGSVVWWIVIFIYIVEFIIGIIAVYFSWTSNTLLDWNAFAKVFFAFWAFVSGFYYLITHLINKLDLILCIKKIRAANTTTTTNTP